MSYKSPVYGTLIPYDHHGFLTGKSEAPISEARKSLPVWNPFTAAPDPKAIFTKPNLWKLAWWDLWKILNLKMYLLVVR